MKIVYINKYDLYGGAAIAAWRLHESLRNIFNTDNSFIVREKKSHHENVYKTINGQYKSFIERKTNKLLDIFGLQYQYFPFSSKAIIDNINRLQPDIISLHNTHGGYFKTSLLSKLSQVAPIVWTLHDMWSFTGNAAHTFGDDSWKRMEKCNNKSIYPAIGINTGKWLLRQKKKIYQKSNLSIVTPSRWLYELASQSPVFHGKKIFHILNGIDLDLYSPINKKTAREVLGLPVKHPALCFSAASLNDGSWKGGGELIKLISVLNNKTKLPISIILLGEGDVKKIDNFSNLRFYRMGYVSNNRFMALCLSAADLFIYPTKADNLPNVLVESIACGTPCVTFDIGGCKEIIIDGENGFVIPPFDIELFVKRIMQVLADKYLQKVLTTNSRKIAENKFSIKTMADKYYQLFCGILNK